MRGRAYDPWKRLIDIVISTLGLVATAPLQLLVAGLVRRRLGSPVLFRQLRPGKDEEIFQLVKFRTMLPPNPTEGLVTDEQRLTTFGRALRATSVDELPTLWNVFRGDMSIVGPRPLLVQYLGLYNDRQRRRHEVRPGVTGLAQVRGRNALPWEEKLEYDVEYVERRSLALDLGIVGRTFATVVRRTGIADSDGASMSEFNGSRGNAPWTDG